MSEQKKLNFGEPLRFRFPEHPWTKNHHNGNPVNPLQKSQIWAANGSRFHTSKRNRKAKSREGHRFVVWMYCLHWFTATKKLLLQYFRIVIWVHIIPYTPSIGPWHGHLSPCLLLNIRRQHDLPSPNQQAGRTKAQRDPWGDPVPKISVSKTVTFWLGSKLSENHHGLLLVSPWNFLLW